MPRLFVPLSTIPFERFARGEKEYGIRRYGRQFTEKNVFRGQSVELRKGYSGESLWGTIDDVRIGTLEETLAAIGYRKAEPDALSLSEAVQENLTMLGHAERYIIFRISIGEP